MTTSELRKPSARCFAYGAPQLREAARREAVGVDLCVCVAAMAYGNTFVNRSDGVRTRKRGHLPNLASEALELDLLAAARRKVLGAHEVQDLEERLADAAVMRVGQ